MADKKPHKRDTSAILTDAAPSSKVPSFITRRSSARPSKKGLNTGGQATAAQRTKTRRLPSAKTLLRIFLVLVTLLAAAAIALAILSNTSAFPITAIEADATEHISANDIATLANVPEGTTMLNFDAATIVQNLKRNPWVADARVERSYPDKLRIIITERKVSSLVMMSSSSVIWCLGDDEVWIEPLKIETQEGQSLAEAALGKAREMDALLITDVPSSVEPKAGQSATDDGVFLALSTFKKEMSAEFWSQIVTISAPSEETISCILESGVEISLGAASSVSTKEAVITSLLEKYPNRITYINVRVASSPSYRLLDTESVQEGTGALGDFTNGTTSSGASSTATTTSTEGSSSDKGGTDDTSSDTSGSEGESVESYGESDYEESERDDGGVVYDSTYSEDEYATDV